MRYRATIAAEGPEQPSLVYPEVFWRDPVPNPAMGMLLEQQRWREGLTIKAAAKRQGLLVSELRELEAGCALRAGLTSTLGAEPLRRALRAWAKRWWLPEWVLNWALYQLRIWPPTNPLDYPLDLIGTTDPRPQLEPWRRWKQTWQMYLDDSKELLERYRDAMLELDKFNDPGVHEAGKRGPGQARTDLGGPDRHVWWTAGYHLCHWSENALAEAIGADRRVGVRTIGVNPRVVSRAIHRFAQLIELPLRPAADNDPAWTAARIRAGLPDDVLPQGS